MKIGEESAVEALLSLLISFKGECADEFLTEMLEIVIAVI